MRLTGSARLTLVMTGLLAIVAGALVTGSIEASHHPGGMDVMSIDMNVSGNTNAAVGTIQSCARINENNLVDADEEDILAISGTVGTATASTLTDPNASWLNNQWSGNRVVITAGTGTGQTRVIASNTVNQITLTQTWATIPNGTSTYEIRFNDAVRVDTTAQGVPAYSDGGTPGNGADDTGGIVAYSFHLTYPAGVKVAAHTSTGAGVTMLTRNPGSSLFDASNATPDSDGLFAADVLDTGGSAEAGSGVLSRFVVQSAPGVPTSVYPLDLSENVHVDASTSHFFPDTTNDRAFIAINIECDSDGDQWPDSAEAVIGTDPFDHCPDIDSDNAWPPDFNNDRQITGFDLGAIAAIIGQNVPPAPARKNIGAPADQGISGLDLSAVSFRIGRTCSN